MTDLELEEMRDRCNAASTGPWEACLDGWTVRDVHGIHVCSTRSDDNDVEQEVDDQDFIAHARTDLPAALDEIERLKKEIASLKLDARDVQRITAYPSQDWRFGAEGAK